MRELALFAGIGGGILGGMLSGFTCVAACEINPYCRQVLLQRQRDGILPKFPIWDDIRTLDGKQLIGKIDIITGGFPCQDISAAGRGAGITGERSGLWKEMARIIGEIRPPFIFVENSPMLIHRGLYTVLADLAALGYDARWGVVSAENAGALHKRERIWILANAYDVGRFGRSGTVNESAGWGQSEDLRENISDSDGSRQQGEMCRRYEPEKLGLGNCNKILSDNDGLRMEGKRPKLEAARLDECSGNNWWTTEPGLDRVAHGIARRVDRLKAIGNAQVPAVAFMAFEILSKPRLP